MGLGICNRETCGWTAEKKGSPKSKTRSRFVACTRGERCTITIAYCSIRSARRILNALIHRVFIRCRLVIGHTFDFVPFGIDIRISNARPSIFWNAERNRLRPLFLIFRMVRLCTHIHIFFTAMVDSYTTYLCGCRADLCSRRRVQLDFRRRLGHRGCICGRGGIGALGVSH